MSAGLYPKHCQSSDNIRISKYYVSFVCFSIELHNSFEVIDKIYIMNPCIKLRYSFFVVKYLAY